jgi:hypothetical protein
MLLLARAAASGEAPIIRCVCPAQLREVRRPGVVVAVVAGGGGEEEDVGSRPGIIGVVAAVEFRHDSAAASGEDVLLVQGIFA